MSHAAHARTREDGVKIMQKDTQLMINSLLLVACLWNTHSFQFLVCWFGEVYVVFVSLVFHNCWNITQFLKHGAARGTFTCTCTDSLFSCKYGLAKLNKEVLFLACVHPSDQKKISHSQQMVAYVAHITLVHSVHEYQLTMIITRSSQLLSNLYNVRWFD